MASNSFVRKGESISWDFTEPFDNTYQDSPVFEIMNSKWMLKFHLYYDQQSLVNHYSIILLKCNGSNLFKPFEITTYLQYKYSGKQHKCSHITVKSTFTTLWIEKRNEIKEKLDLKYYPDGFTIVCVFFPPMNNSPYLNEKHDQSTQATLVCSSCRVRNISLSMDKIPNNSEVEISTQAIPDCSNYKNKEYSLPANKSPDNSAEVFDSNLSNFESLSNDIGSMFSNSLLTDIELKCGKNIIPAHKAVLAARSEVFFAMFKNTLENSGKTVEIGDIEPATLQEFLKYLYSGRLSHDFSTDMLSKLYLASYKYSVLTLQKECSILIAENLNEQNFIKFLKTADAQNDKLLKDAIGDFIVGNPLLLKCSSWISFSDEFPVLSIKIYKKYVEKAFSQ